MTTTDAAKSECGILIIGAGIAGLYTALRLAPMPVTVITAGEVGTRAASSWAQGGLAAAMGPDDSADLHLVDTIAAGAGLVDEHAARILCTEGPEHIAALIDLGVPFDRTEDGSLKLGREAAHGLDRIVHVGGDEAGATIMRVLMESASAAEHITIQERTVAHELMTDAGRVVGATAWDVANGRPHHFMAREVVLATGGSGGLFAVTTNPLTAIGQGLVMANDAGAVLRDLEFMQFHPTGLDIARDPAPLATEALRGDGATLRDAHGRAFMGSLHKDGDLAPRDVVARGVAEAIAKTGHAYLDARDAIGTAFKDRFPTVYGACMEASIDPSRMPMPVAPAAHYHMGGVLTDIDGRSSMGGLWAVGEVASTGVHGANRLASNSLLEALVFGGRCAEALNTTAPPALRPGSFDAPSAPTLPVRPPATLGALRRKMADACGLLRSEAALTALCRDIEDYQPETLGDEMAAKAMALIVSAALSRKESRGAHQRTDFSDLSPAAHSYTKTSSVRMMPALQDGAPNDDG